jgi:hypothetical protein
MSFLHLSSTSALVLNTATASGVFQLTLGLMGIFTPRAILELWGIKNTAATSAKEQTLSESLIRLYGLRNAALGLMILAVRNFADSRTLGWVVLADLIVPIGDGFVQKQCTGYGEWKHWSFVPVGAGMGMLLLGYFD